MAPRFSKATAPLTFDLPTELIGKMGAIRKARNLGTASNVVREAIDAFDFDRCELEREPRQQISVRIAASQRTMLKRYAKTKNASVGELVRLALEAMPVKVPRPRK